jgi:hypothetical protein
MVCPRCVLDDNVFSRCTWTSEVCPRWLKRRSRRLKYTRANWGGLEVTKVCSKQLRLAWGVLKMAVKYATTYLVTLIRHHWTSTRSPVYRYIVSNQIPPNYIIQTDSVIVNQVKVVSENVKFIKVSISFINHISIAKRKIRKGFISKQLCFAPSFSTRFRLFQKK